MGNGTAWGGHLFCNQESRSVRIRYSPPNDADIAQLAEAVDSKFTQCQFKSDYPYQLISQWCNGNMTVSKIVVEGSNPSWDAILNRRGKQCR